MIRYKTTANFSPSIPLYACACKFSCHLDPLLSKKIHFAHIEKHDCMTIAANNDAGLDFKSEIPTR